jgi:hypothetical protein
MRKSLLPVMLVLLVLALARCTSQPPAAVPETTVPQPTTMVEPTTGASQSPLPTPTPEPAKVAEPTPEPTSVAEPTSSPLTSPLPTPTPETSGGEASPIALLAVFDVYPPCLGS